MTAGSWCIPQVRNISSTTCIARCQVEALPGALKNHSIVQFAWHTTCTPALPGDSQALPGYISIYLQISDPRGGSGGKWDCFASYRLAVVNQSDESKGLPRDSWHRFSAKKKSHGWCDFIPAAAVLDAKQGFIVNDVVIVTAEILVLEESVSFTREIDHLGGAGTAPTASSTVVNGAVSVSGDVYSGKFTWRVHNFSLFRETIKTQKIMSPVFPAGECSLRLSVYQSPVGGVEHLSMCLESKDTDKPLLGAGGSTISERSCWCLFRMSVTNQVPGGKSIHRDSYGRFAADARGGDNTSLGWNDYMPLAAFVDEAAGYIVDDTAVFSTTFHIIRESCSFNRLLDKVVRVCLVGRVLCVVHQRMHKHCIYLFQMYICTIVTHICYTHLSLQPPPTTSPPPPTHRPLVVPAKANPPWAVENPFRASSPGVLKTSPDSKTSSKNEKSRGSV